jgi:hypothetical protein
LAILPNGDQPGFSSADPIDEGKCRREIGFSPTMRQQPITVFDQDTFGCIARFVVDLIRRAVAGAPVLDVDRLRTRRFLKHWVYLSPS